mmetsp:Transcript_7066/g.8140  ORF Transcript_7066/g.8140 Transcript_7066/m.8140 type:complete len:360 (-) Transcript_7066:206-1285(-)
MATNNCTTDLDCPLQQQLCYVDVDWLETGESLCFCETWHGWTGNDCNEYGPGAIFYAILVSASLLILLVGFVFSLKAFSMLRSSKLLKRNSAVLTLLLNTFAFATAIGWRASVLAVIFTPEKAGEITGTDNGVDDRKLHPLQNNVEKVFIGVTAVLAISAALNICIVWIQTALNTKAFRNRDNRGLEVLRKVVIVLQVIWIITCVVLIQNAASTLLLVAAAYIFIVMGLYFYGRHQIVKVLEGFNDYSGGGTSSVADSLKSNINKICCSVVVGAIFVIVGGGIYSILSIIDWRNFSEPDSVSPVMVTNECIPLGVTVILFGVLRYMYASVVPKTGTTTVSPKTNGALSLTGAVSNSHSV